MKESEDKGENITNAALVLEKTYKNIDQLMNKMDEIAGEMGYILITEDGFFRWTSNTKPSFFYIRDFVKLYQENKDESSKINPELENSFVNEPILGVQIHLKGENTSETYPVIRIAKYRYDDRSELKNKDPADISSKNSEYHKYFRRPFQKKRFNIEKKENCWVSTPKKDDSEIYGQIKEMKFKEIPLVDIKSERDIREKIFRGFDTLP